MNSKPMNPMNPQPMNGKILFQSKTGSGTVRFMAMLVICVVVFFAAATQFSKAPLSSLFWMVVAFIFLLSTSSGRIVVLGDRFIITNKRFLPGFSDTTEYAFSGIAKIEANLSLTPGTDVLSFVFATGHSRVVKNILSITNKDGSVVNVTPKIYKDDLRKAVQCIQRHSRIEVDIQGNDI
jgi:hypothetical protein